MESEILEHTNLSSMTMSSSSGKKAIVPRSESSKKPKPEEETDGSTDKQPAAPKINKCPVVRLVSGRIYDSGNGKYCHQCRQKTMDFVATCKNQINGKTCTKNICQKCLLNRYGESAEEKAVLEDWNCPRCRGICNCSVCMKKRGHQPTGILVHTAKESGFSSVSELLHVKGPKNVANNKVAKDVDETDVALPTKKRKEKHSTGNVDRTVQSLPCQSSHKVKRAKKTKREALKGVEDKNQDVEVSLKKKKTILPQISHSKSKDAGDEDNDSNGVSIKACSLKPRTGKLEGDKSVNDGTLVESFGGHTKKIKLENKHVEPEMTLPEGNELTSVVGISVTPEDIGHASLLLEFSDAFKEATEKGL